MNNISLYDKNNIDTLILPNNEDAKYAYEYLVPMIKNGVKKYIKNVETDLKILKIDDILLPVNINKKEYENAYTSSLYAHYVAYAKEELWELDSPILEFILKIVLNILGFCLKTCKINKAVYVNNWFLSTNLYFDMSKEQYEKITAFLKEQYPDYAIIFRSLNDNLNQKEILYFQDLGYEMLGSRQVYIFDYNKRKFLEGNQKGDLNRDIKLLHNRGYKVIDLDDKNTDRAVDLYNQLYIDKYSKYNPQFSKDFISLCSDCNLFVFKLLSKNNKINAILGYYKRNNVMTAPVFGYDMSYSKKEGLYRMLSAQLVFESENNGCTINMSSGASKFKINRGAVASFEYSAILYSHLSLPQKFAYKLLFFIVDKIAIPLMKFKKL